MTIKQQITHGTIPKVCHLYNGIFHSIPCYLCHALSIFLSTSPELVTKNNKLWNETKEDFCIYGCFSVSRNIKGGRKSHFQTMAFLDTLYV